MPQHVRGDSARSAHGLRPRGRSILTHLDAGPLSRRARHRLRHGSYGLTENWARIDGRPVRSLSRGRVGDLPEVVMLAGMGAPGYLAPWVRLTSEWTRATVIDLPGWNRCRARSCPPTVSGISTALANWLQSRDLRDAVLLGHSTGAQAVLRTALQAQECVGGVVLAGPGLPPELRRPAPLTREIFTTIPREPADEIESIAPSFISSGGPGLFRLLRDGMVQRPEDLVGELDVPVLVMTGEHDGLAPPTWARHLSQLASTGSLVVLPGAHNACFPHADAADAALHAAVERWAL